LNFHVSRLPKEENIQKKFIIVLIEQHN